MHSAGYSPRGGRRDRRGSSPVFHAARWQLTRGISERPRLWGGIVVRRPAIGKRGARRRKTIDWALTPRHPTSHTPPWAAFFTEEGGQGDGSAGSRSRPVCDVARVGGPVRAPVERALEPGHGHRPVRPVAGSVHGALPRPPEEHGRGDGPLLHGAQHPHADRRARAGTAALGD